MTARAILGQGRLAGVARHAAMERVNVGARVVARVTGVAICWHAAPGVLRRSHVALAACRQYVHAAERELRRSMQPDARDVRPAGSGVATIAGLPQLPLVGVAVATHAFARGWAIGLMAVDAARGAVSATERKAGARMVEAALARRYAAVHFP